MIETGEVRKRVKQAIEQAHRNAAAHRTEADAASAPFHKCAQELAGPLFRQFLLDRSALLPYKKRSRRDTWLSDVSL